MEAEKAESPAFFSRCHLFFTAGCSHSLFSVITAAALLAALYLPRPLLTLLFSPVPISTALLLSVFFRFGSPPTEIPIAAVVPDDDDDVLALLRQESMIECKREAFHSHRKLNICDRDGEWGRLDRRLEVIYEDYEDEEAGGGCSPEWLEWRFDHGVIVSERLCNLKFNYADSGDSGSPEASAVAELWSSPDEIRLQWEEAEERDDMIEIELNEETLIEIDISRNREASATAAAEWPTAVSFTGQQCLTYNLVNRRADM